MNPNEGVIKFSVQQAHRSKLYLNKFHQEKLAELTAWRKTLFKMDIIGCDLSRYGACYGNVSMRYVEADNFEFRYDKPKGSRAFLITGTQTGHLEDLTTEHYVRVHRYDYASNKVYSDGPLLPSSESLTHGAIYDLPLDLKIRYVFHTHSPHLWNSARKLEIPTTPETIAYGTPEMAAEVQCLFHDTDLKERKILSMGGHKDGIISFGSTAEEAATILSEYLAKASQ